MGKAISHYDLHIQGDDTCRGVPCNNISNKNDSYCELTGLYWAWKNIKTLYPNIKYLGLCHYRRYFSFSRIGLFSDSVDLPVSEIKNYKIDHEKLSNILTAKAIILPEPKTCPYPLYLDYAYWHVSEDYRVVGKVIHDVYPKYFSSLVQIMERNNKMSPYNMFIMPFDLVDQYCEWVFDVLQRVESLIPYQYYNEQQKRVFGYLSEWLFNIWFSCQHVSRKYLKVVRFTGEEIHNHSICYRSLRLVHHCVSAHLLYQHSMKTFQ